MDSPVSHASHNTFKFHSVSQTFALIKHIDAMVALSRKGVPLYSLKTFVGHARQNCNVLRNAIANTVADKVKVPASILFWVYRASIHLKTPPPFSLPHICKLQVKGKECFFVTTKEDWVSHRKATPDKGCSHSVALSDHATLKFLTRVLKIDLQPLLAKLPYEQLSGDGTLLDDGRIAIDIDGHQYIMDEGTCITILDKGMLTT